MNHILPQVVKVVMTCIVIGTFYYELYVTGEVYWMNPVWYINIPTFCAHLAFYKQELRDMDYDFNTSSKGYIRKVYQLKNYLMYCILKVVVDGYYDSVLARKPYDIKLSTLRNGFYSCMSSYIIIVSFPKVLCNKYFGIVIDNLKTLGRTEMSHGWFYRTLRSNRLDHNNLLTNLIKKSSFQGTSKQVSGFIVRTLFRGRLSPGDWVCKVFCIVSIPVLQYCVCLVSMYGSGKHEVSLDKKDVKQMKFATLIIYLVLQNYSYLISKWTNRFWSRTLGLPFSLEDSPAHIYDKVHPVELILNGVNGILEKEPKEKKKKMK